MVVGGRPTAFDQIPDPARDDRPFLASPTGADRTSSHTDLAPLLPSFVLLERLCLPVANVPHWVEQLPAHEVEGRPVVEHDVVERVRENLGHPHKASLHVLEKE